MNAPARTLAGLGVTWDDDGRPDGFQVGKSAALLDWQHKRKDRAFAATCETMLAQERVQCQAELVCCKSQRGKRCLERATAYVGGRFVCWVHRLAVQARGSEVELVEGRGRPTHGLVGRTGGKWAPCGAWRARDAR